MTSEPLSLGRLLQILVRFWLMILIVTAVFAVAAFGATQVMSQTYTATATQLVKAVPGIGTTANYEAAQYAVARAKSYPTFIDSAPVLAGVMSDMGGTESVEDLRRDLSATNPADTPLVQLTATGKTPEEAQQKANSLARNLARFVSQIETVGGKAPVVVETAVQADLPERATSPQVPLFVAVGAITGFAAAALLALVLSYRASARRRRRAGSGPAVVWWDENGNLSEERAGHERAHQPVAAREGLEAGPSRPVPASEASRTAGEDRPNGNRTTSNHFAAPLQESSSGTRNGTTSSSLRTKRL